MTVDPELLKLGIQAAETFEGFRAKPYSDPLYGFLTIGYGRNLEGKGLTRAEWIVLFSNGITKQQAEYLLQDDITAAVEWLSTYSWWPSLSLNRQLALVDMGMNLGEGKFKTFTHMIAALASGNYAEAANQMVNSDWYKEVGDRAIHDVGLMKNG